MADYRATSAEITAVADAIRTKGSTSSPLAWPNGFVSAVQAIPTGGGSGKEDDIIDGTISEYSNSSVTAIRNYAFAECAALISVDFPAVTTIGSYAFTSCSSLEGISFPSATSIYVRAFNSCSKLKSAFFPLVTEIGANAFANCSSLSIISFPNAVTVSTSAFASCLSLSTAYFGAVDSIGHDAFKACKNLTDIHLTGSSVCTLVSSDAFSMTPIEGYLSRNGSIYVPASLLAEYQAANNWSFYSSRFRSA